MREKARPALAIIISLKQTVILTESDRPVRQRTLENRPLRVERKITCSIKHPTRYLSLACRRSTERTRARTERTENGLVMNRQLPFPAPAPRPRRPLWLSA